MAADEYRFPERQAKDRETMRDKVRRWAEEESDARARDDEAFDGGSVDGDFEPDADAGGEGV